MIDRNDLFSIETTKLEPTGQIEPQDWMNDTDVQAIFDGLETDGAEVRFVGGCVRDAIARRAVNDIDISTTAKPQETMASLEAAGIRAVPTGLKHGTITAVIHHKTFEITTLREDTVTNGRHAEVTFGNNWIADARRRDFTINAMSASRTGAVYDPFDGISHLAYGRIIFIGKPTDRIAEDYLRILRFFRFYASHGRPPISREALAACRLTAEKLYKLSGERVRDEMLKILSSINAPDTLILMNGEHVLKQILPEARDFGTLRALIWLCTTALSLTDIIPDPIRNLAALLSPDSNPHIATDIASRWRLSNIQRDRLVSLTGFEQPNPQSPQSVHNRQLFKHGAALYGDRCLIAWARETADTANLPRERKQSWIAILKYINQWQPPSFPLTGTDLQDRSIEEGRALGALLDRLREWWIDNDCAPDREACLKKLDEIAK